VLDRARKGEQDLPLLLTSRDLLEFATIAGGAQHDDVGLLAGDVGAVGDQLGLWPLSNAAGAVVNQANTGHVENVFIGGQRVTRHPRAMRVAAGYGAAFTDF
jgi:hypothetical protein